MSEKGEVAIATLNSKVYHSLINELKKRKINFLVRTPNEEIPLSTKAVITTKDEAELIRHHTILTYENAEETVDNALKFISNFSDTAKNKITIGIDPGKTIGLAALNNGKLIQTASHSDLQEAFQTVRRIILSWKPTEIIIKIGNKASPSFNREVSESIMRLSNEFNVKPKILSVDEKYTTVKAKRLKVKRLEKDETSAIEIALR